MLTIDELIEKLNAYQHVSLYAREFEAKDLMRQAAYYLEKQVLKSTDFDGNESVKDV